MEYDKKEQMYRADLLLMLDSCRCNEPVFHEQTAEKKSARGIS